MNVYSKKQVIRSVLLSIVMNGVVPLVVYNLLLSHFSSITALTAATMIPLADNIYHVVKHRRVDAFGMFMLLGFILSLMMLFLGGDEKLLLVRESFVTGIMGVIFLSSLLFLKPLIYHFAIRFTTNGDPAKKSKFEEGWQAPYFRFVVRLMTGVWGLALLGEAVIKTILVYELSVTAFLAVSQIVFYGIIGLTIAWTVGYRRYARKRLEQVKNQPVGLNG